MPRKSSAEYQNQLAQAVRQGVAAEGMSSERLAVYARLVRNNLNNFIDRCYTATPHFLLPEQWANLKELFLQDWRAHTPYFQEIPSEFLAFCQIKLPEILPLPNTHHLCELMRFEHSQLLAETAITTIPETFEWHNETVFTVSAAAICLSYCCDVLAMQEAAATHSQEMLPLSTADFMMEQEITMLTWRDSADDVYIQKLPDLDSMLLQQVMQQAQSLSAIQCELAEVMPESNHEWQEVLLQTWQRWINYEVLLPK